MSLEADYYAAWATLEDDREVSRSFATLEQAAAFLRGEPEGVRHLYRVMGYDRVDDPGQGDELRFDLAGDEFLAGYEARRRAGKGGSMP